MTRAEVVSTDDLQYKNGFVLCACGWRHDLGNGFNGYHIAQCPTCEPELQTRHQRKVVYSYGSGHRCLRADIGDNRYFVMSNGIHVRYHVGSIVTHYGLTEKEADRL